MRWQARSGCDLVDLSVAVAGSSALAVLEAVSARTLVVAVVAAAVGAVLGRRSARGDARASPLLLVAVLVPAIALRRWGQWPEAGVWLIAVLSGAILGSWGRARPSMTPGARSTRSPRPPAPTPAQRRQAGRDLVWMLLFLAGLLLPVLIALLAASLETPMPWRVVAVVVALAATDVPVVVAGTAGRGPQGVLQPWRWTAYLVWLALRLAIALPVALFTFDVGG